MSPPPVIPSPAKNPGAPKSFTEQLAVVPLANRHVRTQPEADGGATVTVDQTYPTWMELPVALLNLRRQRSYRLDPIAFGLLRGADGTRSLATEVSAMCSEHRLSFHEARVLVLSCMALLMQRGLVVLAAPTPSEAPPAPAKP